MTLERWRAAATALAPLLRERAAETERLRRLPDDVARAIHASGLFRLYQPARFGGAEADYAWQVDVIGELGRGCGSAAWVAGVLASHSWVIGMMAPAAQDEVWGDSPDALAANAFYTPGVRVERAAGGFRLTGRWSFASGIDLCDWCNLNVLVPQEGASAEHRFMLVPRRDWTVVDDWHVGGLAGTGSKSIDLHDAFVPEHRTLPTLGLKGGPTAGSASNPSYLYRLPLLALFPLGIAAPALGLTRAAIEVARERVARRGGAAGFRGADQAAVQLRLAEACAMVDAATALLRESFAAADALGRAGVQPDQERRSRWRRDLAFAVLTCQRAVELLFPLNGANGLTNDNPFQRIWRDVHAVASHAALAWDGQAQSYGRVMFGGAPLDPRV